jgi:hypothetical protein
VRVRRYKNVIRQYEESIEWRFSTMELYQELKTKKEAGMSLNIEELTPEILRKLFIEEEKSDYLISQLFDVKESKISYRRK